MKFVVDSMLGKLARWLRILGYDTIYEPSLSLSQLMQIAAKQKAVFLTRRKVYPNGYYPTILFNIGSDNFEEQLRYVVEHFGLDIKTKLFTRCTRCNVKVQQVNKSIFKEIIPAKSFAGYEKFFRCPNCNKIFWSGTHLKNTLNKIEKIFVLKDNQNQKGE